MSSSVRYLIDADVLITAKNLYYRFEFCEAFWQWLIDGHQAGLIFSVNQVRNELVEGKKDDLVRQWMDEQLPDSFFLADKKDNATIKAYGHVMQWATSSTHYTKGAKDEFARVTKPMRFWLQPLWPMVIELLLKKKAIQSEKIKS